MKSILYVFAFLFSISLHAENLVMKITNPQVSGTTVTYDVTTEHFADLIAIQYSIAYDTALLTFSHVQNINLPQLTEDNVYGGIPGAITSLWLDLTLSGTSVADETILYQIVFDMKGTTHGSVCFSEQPLESEFANVNNVLSSYFIVDDCHSDPYEVDLATSVAEIAERFGMTVSTIADNQKISFLLKDEKKMAFRIFDVNGKLVASIPSQIYGAGAHELNLHENMLPGIYILTTEIDHQPVALKIYNP